MGLIVPPKEMCLDSNFWNLWILLSMAKYIIKLRILKGGSYSGLSQWVLNAFTRILMREKQMDFGQIHKKTRQSKDRMERGVPTRMPRNPNSLRKLEEARNRFSLGAYREGALLTPWFQTFGIQNCERVNVFYFKPHSLWWFVIAVTGN